MAPAVSEDAPFADPMPGGGFNLSTRVLWVIDAHFHRYCTMGSESRRDLPLPIDRRQLKVLRLDFVDRTSDRGRRRRGVALRRSLRRTHVVGADVAASFRGPAGGRSSPEEGARAALEMAAVSAAVQYASVGGITLYEANRRCRAWS